MEGKGMRGKLALGVMGEGREGEKKRQGGEKRWKGVEKERQR